MVDMFDGEFGRYSIIEADNREGFGFSTLTNGQMKIEASKTPAERDVETAFRDIVTEAAKPVTAKRTFKSIADRPSVQETIARIKAFDEARRRTLAQ